MGSNFKKVFFIIALALIFLSFDVSAKEYWVKQGASGNGKSKTAPMGELWKAMAKALRGDVIHVAKGEYNGRGGNGEFRIDVPDLTLVGGYNDDFSERNPFKNLTILKTKYGTRVNYTQVVGGIIGLKYEPGKKIFASGLILDGFMLDASSRNKYNSYHQLVAQSSWKEPVIKLTSPDFYSTVNIKIRNCIIVNGYYQGIYVKWWGDKNEVTNTLIVNTMIAGIDNTGTMKGKMRGLPGKVANPRITIKNNTIAFQWSHDKAQQSRGIKLGKEGFYDIENNIIAYTMKPSGEGIYGTGKNSNSIVKGNVFWMTQHPFTGGNDKAQSEAVSRGDDADDDEEEEEEEASTAGGGATGFVAEGNVVKNPGFKPLKYFYQTFTAWGIQFDHVDKKKINEDRVLHGYKKINKAIEVPMEERIWGRGYNIFKLVPGFVSNLKGKGIQINGPFPTYKERKPDSKILGAVPGKKSEYQKITFDDLKAKKIKSGTKVKLKIGLDKFKNRWSLKKKGITPVNYFEFIARKPGKTSSNTSDKIEAYIYIGTKAAARYNKYGNRNVRQKTWKDGIWVRGTIFNEGGYSNRYKYSIVIDYVGKLK